MTTPIDTSRALPPHAGEPVLVSGTPLTEARAAVILLHGRGASAADIMSLAPEFDADGVAFLAPQAAGHTWYPLSFLAPLEANQPGVDSAHAVIERLIEAAGESGLTPDRCALIGFSQGACLAIDHAARFPRRYACIAAYTGGLIGPPGHAFRFTGSLADTPALVSANDPDPHVPWARVAESAHLLESMGAKVRIERYPGRPHSVTREQVEITSKMLRAIPPRSL